MVHFARRASGVYHFDRGMLMTRRAENGIWIRWRSYVTRIWRRRTVRRPTTSDRKLAEPEACADAVLLEDLRRKIFENADGADPMCYLSSEEGERKLRTFLDHATTTLSPPRLTAALAALRYPMNVETSPPDVNPIGWHDDAFTGRFERWREESMRGHCFRALLRSVRNLELILGIAERAQSEVVERSAVNLCVELVAEVTDPAVLTHLAMTNRFAPIRGAAVDASRSPDLARRVLGRDSDGTVRRMVLKWIHDPLLRGHVARSDGDASVRLAAVSMDVDEQTLRYVVLHDTSEKVRLAAIERTNDRDLRRLAALGDAALAVRVRAIERGLSSDQLSAILLDPSIPLRVRRAAVDAIDDETPLRALVADSAEEQSLVRRAAEKLGLDPFKVQFMRGAWRVCVDASGRVREIVIRKRAKIAIDVANLTRLVDCAEAMNLGSVQGLRDSIASGDFRFCREVGDDDGAG